MVHYGGLSAVSEMWALPRERIFNRRCTQMDADRTRTNALSERIIGCAFRVLHTLGAGLLEKTYENALAHELRNAGLAVAQQKSFTVYYDDVVAGEYIVGLLV